MKRVNYFNNLYNSEDEETPSLKNLQRKATKMICQINKLKNKNKTELNDDELNKIKTEYYWCKILDPDYISPEEKIKIEQEKMRHYEKKEKLREKKEKLREKTEKLREKKEKEREKNEKLREERENEREKNEKLREEREKEREREYREREQEWEREWDREREYREREQEHRETKCEENKTMEEKRIDIEFNLMLSQGKTFNYARKKILLKYHPDKNKNENAHRITQIINNKCSFE